ncbi:hypothetical protein MTAT_12200 [Moorella thermoacetica]|uniref:DUF5107 domain-containing protein n=1 Tax=Neomoorella thermoacetica TaxID=1525 RepID=A0AAC9MTK4_NEOTH|nr:hypothetical protein [Moorella thermoacetica]AOQ23638.1 hypothetical protein Maut_01188 [Moorella thermoacetica]TYL13822.1 hypothetical protein MTAT_12200 [Moorella thermoacetica]
MVRIYQDTFRGFGSVILESNELKVTLVPAIGGKMASLVYMETGQELLWQNPAPEFIPPVYDSLYESGDFSGFDEMFPTISECYYPTGPWKGIKLPDHGEVWALPWEYEITDTAVHLWVYGVRMPYKLEKWITIVDENTIKSCYKVTNLAPFAFNFIWAAHPLFNADEHTRIIMPSTVKEVINVCGLRPRLGVHGQRHPWPITQDTEGNEYNMSQLSPQGQGSYDKYYVWGRMQEGWCALHNTASKMAIAISFDPEKVPYLGMWVNEGEYWGQYNVAPEPCTGAYDRVDVATQWGTVAILDGKQTFEWYLNIAIKRVQDVKSVTSEGKIV